MLGLSFNSFILARHCRRDNRRKKLIARYNWELSSDKIMAQDEYLFEIPLTASKEAITEKLTFMERLRSEQYAKQWKETTYICRA